MRALQEPDGTSAIWEVASVEPGLDLAIGAPDGWSRQSTAAARERSLGPARASLRIPHDGSVARAARRSTSAGSRPAGRERELEVSITVVPRRPGLAVSFVLPAGRDTRRARACPACLRLGRWTATFIAPPADGIVWRATFAAKDAARLREMRVAVTDSGFPDGAGWQRLPVWLPQDHTVWTATATWIVPVDAPGRRLSPSLHYVRLRNDYVE